ncbi:MAG: hypothetical protein IPM29_26015 [Planctomycetes bacterium]|nr:hypothetical protein [Planctomycetota bacterium]
MPSLCGKSVGVARRELLAVAPDLTIAIDGPDDAIVLSQIPPADHPLFARRQVRLSRTARGEIAVPDLAGMRVAEAYMVVGELGLDLLIDSGDPAHRRRRPRARDGTLTVVRHLDVTPAGRVLAAGDAVIIATAGDTDATEEEPKIPANCPKQSSTTAEPLPPFDTGTVGDAVKWCVDQGLGVKLFGKPNAEFATGVPATENDKGKEVNRHHECTPAGTRIRPGGTVGLVVDMPPIDPRLMWFAIGAALGFGAGVVVGLAL